MFSRWCFPSEYLVFLHFSVHLSKSFKSFSLPYDVYRAKILGREERRANTEACCDSLANKGILTIVKFWWVSEVRCFSLQYLATANKSSLGVFSAFPPT